MTNVQVSDLRITRSDEPTRDTREFNSHLMPLYAAAAMSDGARAKRLLDAHPSFAPSISLSLD